MLLRTLLAVLLLVGVAGIGFFAGRVTVSPLQTSPQTPPPEPARAAAPPQSDTATRARTVEPPPSPPQVTGSVPEGGPPRTADSLMPPSADAPLILSRRLGLPIAALKRGDIQDTFEQSRGDGEHRHEATDIMAPRGTPVLAVDNGIVKKLFNSKAGGLTVYQFDSAERFCFYYAHLDRYAEGLREGLLMKRGDKIGYVGSTGNADPAAPHLHFAIFELGPEKRWWEGKPINPYPILIKSLK
jgi:murein DD-endopeptidase MepM/ murein hydrolase activator NlpD